MITASERSLENVRADVQYLRFPGGVDLAAALAQLRADNRVRCILCEGGPHLNASLVAAGLIDELFLTTFPRIAGEAGALSIMGDALLGAPAALTLVSLCEHEGELFARYGLNASIAG